MHGTVTTCPDALDLETPPRPDTLTYSFTLPAGAASPAIARRTTAAILSAHGLHEFTDAAVQAVSELITCAARFTGSPEIYLSLRYRDDTLRMVVYDGHARHTHPRLATTCDARRRSALRLLVRVVRACNGDWGFGDSREPGGGTRMWAVLPRHGTRSYGTGT